MSTTIEQINPDILVKISDQVNKLIKKANSTDSPDEAATCVALAQKMLFKNNLTEAMLLTEKELKERTRPKFKKDGVKVGKNAYAVNYDFNSRHWKEQLLNVLAKSFFCRLADTWCEVVTIVGQETNVQIVQDMFVYLEKQIRASRKVAFRQACADGKIERANPNRRSWYEGNDKQPYNQRHVHAWKNSFAQGAVEVLGKRLEAQQRENIEEANNDYVIKQQQLNPGANLNDVTHTFGNALVVQIHNELDEAFYEFYPEAHPAAIALARYKVELATQARLAEAQRLADERDARIAAGLELPPEPPKPYKEPKRRGRKPGYNKRSDNGAYMQGREAGQTMRINVEIGKGKQTALPK